MRARTEYPDLELGLPNEEKAPYTSSTSFVLKLVGIYPEFSIKEKLFLLFCASFISYEFFGLIDKTSHHFMNLFVEESDSIQNWSKNVSGFISLIIFMITLRILGKELKNLEQYANQVDRHNAQLLNLKMQLNEHREKTPLQKSVGDTESKKNETRPTSKKYAITLLSPIDIDDSQDEDEEVGPELLPG